MLYTEESVFSPKTKTYRYTFILCNVHKIDCFPPENTHIVFPPLPSLRRDFLLRGYKAVRYYFYVLFCDVSFKIKLKLCDFLQPQTQQRCKILVAWYRLQLYRRFQITFNGFLDGYSFGSYMVHARGQRAPMVVA